MSKPANWVRLACDECDRDDKDGITPEELEQCKKTWFGITEYQTYEESMETYEVPDDAPPGFSVLDWYTHIGTCPDCDEGYSDV